MRRINLLHMLMFGAALLPIVTWSKPELGELGITMMFFGFALGSFVGLVSSFRQHKWGLFTQWVAPSKFVAMRFNEVELWLLKAAAILTTSGLASMFTSILVGDASLRSGLAL